MIADCYCSHVAINSGDKRLLYPFLIILVINVLLYLYLYVKLLCILLEPCQGRRNSPTQLTHSLKTCTYIGLPSELSVSRTMSIVVCLNVHLKQLHASVLYSWNALVHKNFEIEKACVELEKELETLREKLGQR